MLGQIGVAFDWLFTGLIDVLRNLGDHDEHELAQVSFGELRGLLKAVIESILAPSASLLRLHRESDEVNRLRNLIVHAHPVPGHPHLLVASKPSYFDVAARDDLRLLEATTRRLASIADNVVKDAGSPFVTNLIAQCHSSGVRLRIWDGSSLLS